MKTMKFFAAAALFIISLTSSAANNHSVQLQHRYDRDDQGRVTARTAYAWNGEDWKPALRWSYTYTDTGYTVELSRYDYRHECFGEPLSKTIYAYTAVHSIAYVCNYTLNDTTHAYELTSTMLLAASDIETGDILASNQ